MLSAYVLILTEIGKVAHVAQALNDLEGVESAEDLAGPYDVIARVQAPAEEAVATTATLQMRPGNRIPEAGTAGSNTASAL
jgi:hypothetical protein